MSEWTRDYPPKVLNFRISSGDPSALSDGLRPLALLCDEVIPLEARRAQMASVLMLVSSLIMVVIMLLVAENFVFGVIAAIVAGIPPFIVMTKARAKKDLFQNIKSRAAQCESLFYSVVDEALPGSRIAVNLDLRDPKDDAKITRQAYNATGKRKVYYLSRWLRINATLAEGSSVSLRLQRAIKQKRGVDLTNKRRLIIKLVPSSRYATERLVSQDLAQALRRSIKRAVNDCFHDPPEELHVRPDVEAGVLTVKIVQYDAEIFLDEVIAILGAILTTLDRHARSDRPRRAPQVAR